MRPIKKKTEKAKCSPSVPQICQLADKGPVLLTFPPLLPTCWNFRCEPPWPGIKKLRKKSKLQRKFKNLETYRTIT